jgi:hypothetical protein
MGSGLGKSKERKLKGPKMSHEERELVLADVLWDAEFAEVMRPHLPEEADDFTESIMAAGKFTCPLLVIEEKGKYPLVDGYHRLAWYTEYGEGVGIEPPAVMLMERFTTRAAAKYWMRVVQNGRRNMTIEDQRFHRGKALVEKVLAMRTGTGDVADAVREFAEENKISNRTAYREKEYATALSNISQVDNAFSEKIRAGVVGINFGETVELSKRMPEHIENGIVNLEAGRHWKDNGAIVDELPQAAKDYRDLERLFSTLHKTLMPAVREHFMDIHRIMYPKGPVRGGFPMKLMDDATTTIIGAVNSWKPRAPCPDCEFRGCGRCKRLGWLRGRPQ